MSIINTFNVNDPCSLCSGVDRHKRHPPSSSHLDMSDKQLICLDNSMPGHPKTVTITITSAYMQCIAGGFDEVKEALLEDPGVYTEMHHIWPTCIGGPDEAWNKAEFLYRRHVQLHLIIAQLACWHPTCRAPRRM